MQEDLRIARRLLVGPATPEAPAATDFLKPSLPRHITDACIGGDETRSLVLDAADGLAPAL